MITVRVKLFANLKDYARVEGLPGTPFDLEIPDGFTLGKLVKKLKLPSKLVKITFVNGIAHELDYELKPGDEVGIFPPIGGG